MSTRKFISRNQPRFTLGSDDNSRLGAPWARRAKAYFWKHGYYHPEDLRRLRGGDVLSRYEVPVIQRTTFVMPAPREKVEGED